MSDRPEHRRHALKSSVGWRKPKHDIGSRHTHGQAMVEYALIAVLVCVAIAAVVTAPGPTIGNIFSNTIYNLLGQRFTVEAPLSRDDIFDYASQVAGYTLPPPAYQTNTPLAPTCYPAQTRTWAPIDDLGTWTPC